MALELFELRGIDDRRFSPYCWRSRLALAHKGLEAQFVGLPFSELADRLAFSSQARVPVLRDGETVVHDSWSIACYLEERYPYRPPLFGDDAGRSLARFLNHWTDTQLHPVLLRLVVGDIFRWLDPSDRDYFKESREARLGASLESLQAERDEHLPALKRVLAPLRKTLSDQTFISGEAPAYADYIVMGSLQWARRVSDLPLLQPDDPIHAWRERMLDLFDGLARHEGAPRPVDAEGLR